MGEGIPDGAYPEYVHSCHLQTGMDILIPLLICEDADTIPTRNGRELGEIWVSKVGTNF